MDPVLEHEVSKARRDISTDSYSMSIGELTSMYTEGDLVISPPFQRLFRWDDDQKSRLIESILIGIPLPSLFVAQDEQGRWELVDGLQRVSTLLQLIGLLDDEEFPPLKLRATKYLPSLDGLVWEDEENPSEALTPAHRRDIKRAKIDVKIVQRESDRKTKYDLFQRLNSFGSKLSNQEMRNAQLVGINSDFVAWVSELANYDSFVTLLKLPERSTQQKYDEELVLRFLYLSAMSDDEIRSIRNFQDGLEDFAIDLALEASEEYMDRSASVFRQTFDRLVSADDKLFGRWDAERGDFKGGFLNSSFEALAVSLGYLILKGESHRSDLRDCAIEFWSQPEMKGQFATGKSTEARLRMLVPTGRRIVGVQ